MKTITNEKEYLYACGLMNAIIGKGTELGDMELLSEADKNEYIQLSGMVRKWESIHYPFPIPANTLIAEIRKKMIEQNLKQKEAAEKIGIDESRMSEIMRGKRKINLNIAKKLNTELHIPADIILEFS